MATKIVWEGKQVTDKVRSAAMRGIVDGAEAILDRSNSKAPIDEGTMIGSGQVTPDERTLSATISYDTKYAIRQHEDLSLRHDNGRSAKFLENAAKELAAQVQNYIANQIKGAL